MSLLERHSEGGFYMSSFAMSTNFYNEWNARQTENEHRLPLWAKNERIFNCDSDCRHQKVKKLFGFLKRI